MLIGVILLRGITWQKPLLVTGFEAFGNMKQMSHNPLPNLLHHEVVRGHVIQSLTLSVDYDGSIAVSNMLDEHEFAAIIHIGLASKFRISEDRN